MRANARSTRIVPQTCLDYDCRIFSAAGLEAGKTVIDRRRSSVAVHTIPSTADRQAHDAVLATAARSSGAKRAELPLIAHRQLPPASRVLAIKAYSVFSATRTSGTASDIELAAAIVEASRAFDAGARF